jgi:hypothetical protein
MRDLFARLGARALGTPGMVRPATVSLFLPRSSGPGPDASDPPAEASGLDDGVVVQDDATAATAPVSVSSGASRGVVAGPGLPWPGSTTRPDRQDEVAAPETPARRPRGGLPRMAEPAGAALSTDAIPTSKLHAHLTRPVDGGASPRAAVSFSGWPTSGRDPALDDAADAVGAISPASPRLTAPPPGLSTRGWAPVPAAPLAPIPREAGGDVQQEPNRRAHPPGPAGREREVNVALARLRRLGAAPVEPRVAAGAPATPERIVRISIGRIDVRAVPPAVPAPPVSRPRDSARPRLSLEDYLTKKGRSRT